MEKVTFGWTPMSVEQEGKTTQELLDLVCKNLDRLRDQYDVIWFPDHLMGGSDDPKEVVLEGWTMITYLAAKYPNYKFGPMVMCQSYRNPALLAKMAATLQLLTDGRLILGIGAGWLENEYAAYGYEYPNARDRIEQLSESIDIIRKLWTEEKTTYEGRHYQIYDAYCEPKPHIRPPILVGGTGVKYTLRVVAEKADWWNIVMEDVEASAHKCTVLRKHCDDVGRDYESIVKTWAGPIALGRTEDEAIRIARTSPGYEAGWLKLVGPPSKIIDMLNEYTNLGIEHFVLPFVDFPSSDGAVLFAEEVAPHIG